MERSQCPECGASIGGQNHRLDSTNRPAREFEELVRRENPNAGPAYWNY